MTKVKVFKQIYNWVDERVEMHDYIKKDILDKPIPKGINLSYCFGGITYIRNLVLRGLLEGGENCEAIYGA